MLSRTAEEALMKKNDDAERSSLKSSLLEILKNVLEIESIRTEREEFVVSSNKEKPDYRGMIERISLIIERTIEIGNGLAESLPEEVLNKYARCQRLALGKLLSAVLTILDFLKENLRINNPGKEEEYNFYNKKFLDIGAFVMIILKFLNALFEIQEKISNEQKEGERKN